MLGETFQAGVSDPLDAGVIGQEAGHRHGVVVVALHAQGQCLDAPQDEPGVEGADDPAQIAQHALTGAFDKGGGPGDGPRDGVAVSAEVLGRAVQDDVGAEREGELVDRRGEGVVHEDEGRLQSPLSGPVPDPVGDDGDVVEGQGRVARALKVDQSRVLLQRSHYVGWLCSINERRRHAVGRQLLRQQRVCGRVDGLGRHYVVTALDSRQHRRGDGSHTRCCGQGVFSSFEGGYAPLQGPLGGIAPTGVDEALALAGEELGALLGGAQVKGGGQVDGRC